MMKDTPRSRYPLTARVLRNMSKYRYMPQHNAFAGKVFGLAVRFETGVDLNELLTLAQIVELSGNLELATGENRPNAETVTVADLVENLKDLGKLGRVGQGEGEGQS
jgi:hypothetical protein